MEQDVSFQNKGTANKDETSHVEVKRDQMC